MQLSIVGGGGFRTPLVYQALQATRTPVHRVDLYDVDPVRLRTITTVLNQLRSAGGGPPIRAHGDAAECVAGAGMIFSAIRVGGLAGRVADEKVALGLGVLGQETTGAGGIAFGLRTIPTAIRLAELVRRLAPDAWVVNFTNPAGMVTEAMQAVLGDRVVGVCDSPDGLIRRAANALGLTPDAASADYAGLNHLGWLSALRDEHGVDLLPQLIADPARLTTLEEGELFGTSWLQDLGSLPNEYLYYYYFTRDAIAELTGRTTRGEYLLGQQTAFYEAAAASPHDALARWAAARRRRDETYFREHRDPGHDRDEQDIEHGGYETVAVRLLVALAGAGADTLVLNVRNGDTLPSLPPDAVVEVPCQVTPGSVRPLPVTPLTGHRAGLAAQVKQAEELTIAAARAGSPRLARTALAVHPLVDSVRVADRLLAQYRRRIPELDAVFRE